MVYSYNLISLHIINVFSCTLNALLMIHLSDETSSKAIEDQLFSSSLLRLWRTGADKLLYSLSEDGDLDVSNTKSSY